MTLIIENIDEATAKAIKSVAKLNPKCKIKSSKDRLESSKDFASLSKTMQERLNHPSVMAVFERLKDK